MKLRRISWGTFLALLLAAFFIVGAIGNIFVTEKIAFDYMRWGYPDWFHYITGLMELSTATLLIQRSLRLWGALLGATIMIAASATVLLHSEYPHAVAPLVVLIVAITVGWLNRYQWRSAE
ncbi:TPA: DoxX family protein [Burkholderia cenocepacia]|nr:DoxX family protein [Burkholderia cenocepacia]